MDPNQKGPFDKDVLEGPRSKQQEFREETPPLSERDFIREPKRPLSFPLWLWLFLATTIIAIIWGMMGWYEGKIENRKSHEPFLEVTNREMSVFLWQFPSFIRSNVSKKTAYLPGFLIDKPDVDLRESESLVIAPPELLFLYHTWDRLLASDYISRPFTPAEFTDFLAQQPLWAPANWKKAPKGYVELVNQKAYEKSENLESLPYESLPLVVRQAFQGWKNYFKEGSQINALNPTIAEVEAFLSAHPSYARHNWVNVYTILDQQIAGPLYLQLTLHSVKVLTEKFPADQLAPFLKVALFDAKQP